MASYLNKNRENFSWNQPNSRFVAFLLKPSPDTEPPPQQPQSEVILVRLVHCVIRQQGNPRAMDNPKKTGRIKLVESCWCLLESGLAVGDTSWGKICFFFQDMFCCWKLVKSHKVSWFFVRKHFQVVEFESIRPKKLTYPIQEKQRSSSKHSNWRGELLVRRRVQKKTLERKTQTCKRGLPKRISSSSNPGVSGANCSR